MSSYRVGLTGGIASGKSTVADHFVSLGAGLVDTDAIAHELTGPDGAAMPEIIAAFGAQIADVRGALDRAAMRRLVFADAGARRVLESILHPRIREEADRRCAASLAPYVLLAVPLLVESGQYRERCDRILVVDCPEALQLQRVMARSGLSEAEAQAILAAQATRAARLAIADDVLDNTGDLDSLLERIESLHADYLQAVQRKLKASC